MTACDFCDEIHGAAAREESAGVRVANARMGVAADQLTTSGMRGGGATGGLASCEARAHDADGGEGFVGGGNAAAGEKDAVDLGTGERTQWDRGREGVIEEAQLCSAGGLAQFDGPGGVGGGIGEIAAGNEILGGEGVLSVPAIGFPDAGLTCWERSRGGSILGKPHPEEIGEGFCEGEPGRHEFG